MRVLTVRIDDFEDAVVFWGGVCAAGAVHHGFADLVEVAVGVCGFVEGGGVGFFVEDCVVVAVDCGVDACCAVVRRSCSL